MDRTTSDSHLSVESGEVEKRQPRQKRQASSVSFSRPPSSKEVMADAEYQKRFDELQGRERHLIKRILDHGDLKRAAKEAGLRSSVGTDLQRKLANQKDIRQALAGGGIDSDSLVYHLMDCLEANTTRFDKHGNPIQFVDHNLKLKTLETIFKLRGDYEKGKTSDSKPAVDLFEDTDLESD